MENPKFKRFKRPRTQKIKHLETSYWASGSPYKSLSKGLGFWVFGCLDFWMFGCLSFWICECLDYRFFWSFPVRSNNIIPNIHKSKKTKHPIIQTSKHPKIQKSKNQTSKNPNIWRGDLFMLSDCPGRGEL